MAAEDNTSAPLAPAAQQQPQQQEEQPVSADGAAAQEALSYLDGTRSRIGQAQDI